MRVDLEAVLLGRRTGPSQTGARRAYTMAMTNLISVPGLHEQILEIGGYPIGDTERLEAYPFPTSNLTIFDVARWLAHLGYCPAGLTPFRPYNVQRRHQTEGRALDSDAPFSEFPLSADLPADLVPRAHQLPLLPGMAAPTTTPAGATSPTIVAGMVIDEPALVHGSVLQEVAPPAIATAPGVGTTAAVPVTDTVAPGVDQSVALTGGSAIDRMLED